MVPVATGSSHKYRPQTMGLSVQCTIEWAVDSGTITHVTVFSSAVKVILP
jgi:hypothetical protein